MVKTVQLQFVLPHVIYQNRPMCIFACCFSLSNAESASVESALFLPDLSLEPQRIPSLTHVILV